MKILLAWLLMTTVQAVPHSFLDNTLIDSQKFNENMSSLQSRADANKLTITFNKSFGGGLLAADLNNEINKLEALDTDNKVNIATLNSGELISGTRVNKFFTDLENAITTIGRSNYFGDGSDGDVTITGNTSLPVTKVSGYNYGGSYDGDMVVKNYNNLTIDAGATLTTASPARGLLLYVKGNLVVNGTISMTARGAYTPSINSEVNSQGLQFQRFTDSGTDSTPTVDSGSTIRGAGNSAETSETNQKNIDGSGTIFSIPKVGGAGGVSVTRTGSRQSAVGGTGGSVLFGTGGGGGGNVYTGAASVASTSGAGAAGTCFSGGAGGGSANGGSAQSGGAFGGRGGNATATAGTASGDGGGGNPGGSGANGGGALSGSSGFNGTGGLLIMIVKGSVTINGTVSANGKDGGSGPGQRGGGSGGGSILVLHGGVYTNNGTIQANGGSNGGGAGSISISQILK